MQRLQRQSCAAVVNVAPLAKALADAPGTGVEQRGLVRSPEVQAGRRQESRGRRALRHVDPETDIGPYQYIGTTPPK